MSMHEDRNAALEERIGQLEIALEELGKNLSQRIVEIAEHTGALDAKIMLYTRCGDRLSELNKTISNRVDEIDCAVVALHESMDTRLGEVEAFSEAQTEINESRSIGEGLDAAAWNIARARDHLDAATRIFEKYFASEQVKVAA
jgi:DNA anti-recombination protein RmuC